MNVDISPAEARRAAKAVLRGALLGALLARLARFSARAFPD